MILGIWPAFIFTATETANASLRVFSGSQEIRCLVFWTAKLYGYAVGTTCERFLSVFAVPETPVRGFAIGPGFCPYPLAEQGDSRGNLGEPASVNSRREQRRN